MSSLVNEPPRGILHAWVRRITLLLLLWPLREIVIGLEPLAQAAAAPPSRASSANPFYHRPRTPAPISLRSAPSTPTLTPVFNAVSGQGYLQLVATNTSDCVWGTNVWFTNVLATLADDGTVNVVFTIAGGDQRRGL